MEKAIRLAWNTLREFFRFAKPYWPVLAGLIVVYLLALLLRRRKVSVATVSNAVALDYFFRQGYEVEELIYQGRLGAECVLSRQGIRVYIQIKWWRKPIDQGTVLAVKESRYRLGCELAIIISKEGFTRRARRLGLEAGIWLWPFSRLELEMERLEEGICQGIEAAAATKSR